MASTKSKADKAADFLNEITVAEWDELLRVLADKWETAFDNRQRQARREGITTPPPTPPGIQMPGAMGWTAKSAPASDLVTVENLIDRYLTDGSSPFHELRPSTKANYVSLTKRLRNSCGPYRLADLEATSLSRLYEGWIAAGIPIGNSLMTFFRLLVGYGSGSLQHPECQRLSGALRRFKFKTPAKVASGRLTTEQAKAICARARELRCQSIGLVQAIQFDLGLRQKDLIGEWVDESEKGTSDIFSDGKKWLTGARWENLNNDFVLTHVTSKHQELIHADLKAAPMVMEELERDYPGCTADRSLLPASGPIIVCEKSKEPWTAVRFRRMWRKIADDLNLPVNIKNRDTRSGAADDDDTSEGDETLWGAEADASAPRH